MSSMWHTAVCILTCKCLPNSKRGISHLIEISVKAKSMDTLRSALGLRIKMMNAYIYMKSENVPNFYVS